MPDVTLILRADNSDYVKKVKEAQDATQKLHDSSEKGMKREKGLIEDIEQELDRLQKARKKSFTFEEIEKYNKKIAEAKQALKEYDEAGIKAAKSTDTFTQSIGKWLLSAAGVATILNTLTKALKETETGFRLFNNVIAASKQVLYDFVTGAGLAVDKMVAAYKIQSELDDLRRKERVTTVATSKAQAEYNKLRLDAYDRTKSEIERADILRKAIEKYNEVAAIRSSLLKEELDAIEKSLILRPQDTKLLDQQANVLKEIFDLASRRDREVKELQSIETGIRQQQNEADAKRVEMIKKWYDEIDATVALSAAKRRNALDKAGLIDPFLMDESTVKFLEERFKKVDDLQKRITAEAEKIFQKQAEESISANEAIIASNERLKQWMDERGKSMIDALKDGLEELANFITMLTDREVEDAERRREILDTRISELQRELETETELYAAGFAANVSLKKKELEDLKKIRAQALKDEEEAIRRQRAMESIAQGVNIFTSATQILKTFTKDFGPLGLALAAGAITAMFALVANWKSKSSEVTKLAVGGSGDTGTIKGRRHAQGGERFLDHIEVEGGESWGVLSIPATKKFGKVFHHMVSSFNKGEIPQIAGARVSNNVMVENNGPNSRLDKVNDQLNKLNAQLKNSDYLQDYGNRVIIRKGSKIRVITK